MIECITRDGCKQANGLKHVLCIQDTSEFCYDHNKGRLSLNDSDLGYGTNKEQEYCLYAHPTLMVDAESHMPVGFSDIIMYNHDRNRLTGKSKHRNTLTIKEKESYRWAKSAIDSANNLPSDVRKTMVGDRENDVYTVMCMTLESGCDFLIRSLHNRVVNDCSKRIEEHMACIPIAGIYEISLRGHRGRKSRKAKLEVRYDKVLLHKTKSCIDDVTQTLECYCVLVTEHKSTVPPGEKPIEWRLYTSHTVENMDQAIQCIDWYKCRWYIEELFRICKSEGFRVESSQIATGANLKKLIVITLYASLRCMTLKMSYDNKDETVPADKIFSKDEIQVLKSEMIHLHEISPRSKDGNNPFKEVSLPWAAWIIARLGSWQAYSKSFGPPGYMTIKRGLDVFQLHCEAVAYLAKNTTEDVYKE